MTKIHLRDLLDSPAGKRGKLRAWVPYKGTSWRLHLEHVSAEDQRKHYARISKGGREPSILETKEFWLAHLLEWVDFQDDDGTEIAYSDLRARNLFELDSEFADWLVREAKTLDNFRTGASTAEAALALASQQDEGPLDAA